MQPEKQIRIKVIRGFRGITLALPIRLETSLYVIDFTFTLLKNHVINSSKIMKTIHWTCCFLVWEVTEISGTKGAK